MKKILFISNLTSKITSFASSSIYASQKMGMGFYHVANWSNADKDQIRNDEEKYHIKIYNVPISRSPFSISNIKAYIKIRKIIKENDIDYIHCNTPVGGFLGRLAGKRCEVKKIIYQAHGFHFYKGAPKKNWLIFYNVEKHLAHYTDAIITMNSEDNEAANKFKLRNNGKVYNVHGVGIDLKEYEGIEQYRDLKRKELGFSPDDIVLISMGDLILRKNYKTAIEAIYKANNPNLKYLICGKGEELDNLKSLASHLDIDKQVFFLGFRTDVKELLAAADIFLFTTLQEGLPRSLMEAMAAGLPCVASKIRGNVDLIEDGRGGYLCNPTDTNSFAEAINLLASDRSRCFQMRKYNLDNIKNYDISEVQKEIYSIYKNVLK